MHKLLAATTGIGFRRKLLKYQEAGIITKAMKNKFEVVNKYRDWFGHGLGYQRKLEELRQNRNQQKILLENLLKALRLLNDHFGEREKKLDALKQPENNTVKMNVQ